MSGLIKTWLRRLSVNTCTIVNPVELRWHGESKGREEGEYVCLCMWVMWCSCGTIFILLPPCLACNTLDPLVTNPSWWLSDGPSASLNLLLINLSLCITLNIRSSWRGTGGICLCITGGRPLLEKPTRFISVIKWCVSSLKEALGRKREGESEKQRQKERLQMKWEGKRSNHVSSLCLCVHVRECWP